MLTTILTTTLTTVARGSVEPDHGHDGADDCDDGDDGGAGEDGAQDAGASAKVGGVGFGGLLAFLGVAEFGLALFFFLLEFLVFSTPGCCQVVAGGPLGQAVVVSGFGSQCFGVR